MDGEKVRAFICIDFEFGIEGHEDVIKEIARVQELIGKKKFVGKLTELENLHLTLKFLGEISEDKLKEVKERLGKIEFKEFEAHLLHVGCFVYKRNPRIAWVKIAGKEIYDLQKRIDEVLEGLFTKEERFMSHLTLARIKYVKDKKEFIDYIEKLSVKPLKFKVKSFKLKESKLGLLGPDYSDLKVYSLK